jgi:23S rRNA pseudouridine955/2504/2580 synthase
MEPDTEGGLMAVTEYRIIEHAGRRAAWLLLEPLTGRTHQLRVHCAAIGTPILGDGKYGGPEAVLEGDQVSRKLHLHARWIEIPHPAGGVLAVTAPLPEHMSATWRFLGFSEQQEDFTSGRRC